MKISIILLFLFIALIIIFLFLVLLVYKIIKMNKKIISLLKLLNEYEFVIDEQGKKNHEYNNQLMIISGYLNNKEKLKKYLGTIIEDHKTGQNYEIRQLSHFPTGGIKQLLYYKLLKMKDYNIKYFLYISDTTTKYFEKLDIKIYKDLTKLLGIFIDNAIDAAKDSLKKEIELNIEKEDSYLNITIANTFNNDIKELGKKGFTTKGYGHGFGLSIVKDICNINNMIEVVNDRNKDKFSQIILVDISNIDQNMS